MMDLNGTWAFRFEEGKSIEEVADPCFTATDSMVVPGCWDMMPRWYLKRGTALCRRTFTLSAPVDNAWLVVEGMGLRGDFRIDGRPLGVRPFPYARLELETGPLGAGEHTIFAALDNRFDWATMKLARPYYDFYLHGGFYHGVSLAFDNRRLLVRTRDWREGVVEIEAANFPERDFDATLLFDGSDEVAATFRDGRATVRVPDASPWSPEAPNLHTVGIVRNSSFVTRHSSLRAGVSARFGIRQVEARDGRIFLNGKPVFLLGVNRHDTGADCGPATTDALMLRDLQLLKSLGANFVRGAHYQQPRRFLDLCDELGVLVWEESLGWGNGQNYTRMADAGDELADEDFREQQVEQTRAMVRDSFNHPCVILAGFLNECDSGRPECRSLVERLVAAIRAEDSGRLVTFACNDTRSDVCHDLTDVVAFNTYPGTIPNLPGTPAELAEKVRGNDPPGDQSAGIDVIAARFHGRYPDKPIILSESGVGALYGLHDPESGLMSEEFQEEYIRDIIETVQANPLLSGCTLWQMNDNRTYHRNSPGQPAKQMAGWSIAGIFDRHRRPKLAVGTVRELFTRGAPK